MKRRIAIVGAGAAGLMAALELRAKGHHSTIFEARDRVGGRIHTVRFPDGRFANAGAEWLNSSDSHALSLVERYNLVLVERFGFEAVVDDGAPDLGDEVYPGIDEPFQEAVSGLTDLLSPWNDRHARELDRFSVAEWVFLTGADRRTIRRFFKAVEGEFMAPVTEVSMAAAVLSAATTTNDRAFRFRDGTASLPEAMAADLDPDSIHLDEAVVAIEQRSDGVEIRTTSATYQFDAAIVTVPLPALRTITITPDPDIPWIAQGRGGKLMVAYENDSVQRPVATSPGTRVKFTYVNASHRAGDGIILTGYSNEVISADELRATFSRWFPDLEESKHEPIAAWWSLDPYSGTTYSAPQPGYLDDLRRLREPRERIFLAGEHTEILFGYIESALASGRRVAEQVASAIV